MYCKNCSNTGVGMSKKVHIKFCRVKHAVFNSANLWTVLMKAFKAENLLLFLSKPHCLRKIKLEYLGWSIRHHLIVRLGGYMKENLQHNNVTEIKILALNVKEIVH